MLIEWANFLARWVHLIAGISWIGNSFYFMWLDSAFEAPQVPKSGTDGELYMVHGGHFYHVEKQKIRPGHIPKTLHWFKWEATLTWLSGFVLMILFYYLTNGVYLISSESPVQSPQYAVLMSLGFIFGSWFVYDLLWQVLGEKSKNLTTAISLALLVALCWTLCKLFSGRGAFIHLGAIFATLMVLNVWIRILPGQAKMFEIAKAGGTPDYTSGARAKSRSTHNSYMTLPVLFTMLSNHFPLAFGNHKNWVVLFFICLLGGCIRHMMIQWNKEKTGAEMLVPISVLLLILFFLTSSDKTALVKKDSTVSFAAVSHVMKQRCLTCHSVHPTDDVFVVPPNGVVFDDPKVVQKFASRIKERVWQTKTMPLINKTQITEEERELLANWVDSGAKID